MVEKLILDIDTNIQNSTIYELCLNWFLNLTTQSVKLYQQLTFATYFQHLFTNYQFPA